MEQQFWNWFTKHQEKFHQILKEGGTDKVTSEFFEPLGEELEKICDGIYYLSGMYDENTAELILTPEAVIKNIAIVEELVKQAPALPNWRFTALKPEMTLENGIQTENLKFDKDNLFFYDNSTTDNAPDLIDLALVYADYKEELKDEITMGTFLYLDNYLGELRSVTSIDYASIVAPADAEKELIPIHKLKDYLIWREKEFVEKYSAISYSQENDEYGSFEYELEDGTPIIAIMDATLLRWDEKQSHSWMLEIKFNYTGQESGMPTQEEYEALNDLEDQLATLLKDKDGYLNIGRETGAGVKQMYIACKEFRKASLIMHNFKKSHQDQFDIDFTISNDKYWLTLRGYINAM